MRHKDAERINFKVLALYYVYIIIVEKYCGWILEGRFDE